MVLTLQGCGQKTSSALGDQPSGAPSYQPGDDPRFQASGGGYMPSGPSVRGRYTVDGHRCEQGWWVHVPGHTYTCHNFCCYHRNANTGRRTLHSYCRAKEFGYYALKACQPQYLAAAEVPPVSIADLGELVQAEVAEWGGTASQEGLVEEEAERNPSAEEAEALAKARAAAQWRMASAERLFAGCVSFAAGGLVVAFVLHFRGHSAVKEPALLG